MARPHEIATGLWRAEKKTRCPFDIILRSNFLSKVAKSSTSLPTLTSRPYRNHFSLWLNLWVPAGIRVASTGSGLYLQVRYVTIFHAFNKTQLKINRSRMAI